MLFFGQNFVNSFLLLDARLTALLSLLGKGIGHALQTQIVIASLVTSSADATSCSRFMRLVVGLGGFVGQPRLVTITRRISTIDITRALTGLKDLLLRRTGKVELSGQQSLLICATLRLGTPT